jgi:Icc-related predicted phosphoesterase
MRSRLFFSTDLHGSEVCFRKFLHAGQVYDASVVIMGGDCTGKMLIPVVATGSDGEHRVTWNGETLMLTGDSLDEVQRRIRDSGMYPVRMSLQEFEALQSDSERRVAAFRAAMTDTLRGWMELAADRLERSGKRMIVTPGNDDEFEVDDVLRASTFVEAPEGRVIMIDDEHELLSLGWSNKTPWQTPRECSEEELAEKIRVLAEQVHDMDRAIFNIHVPPYGTGLDEAPELAEGARLVRGGAVKRAVGSTAVRDALLKYQPMLSLHGHVHESRGIQRLGRTVAINPGSAYGDSVLQGVVVDVEGAVVKRYVPVTG